MNVKHPNRLYKSDRLNHIVSQMRLNQDITPAKLAKELQVSERTIYRDLRYLETGNALKKRYSRREGRYMLETELHLPPLTFTPSEALALFNAASNPALAQDNFYASDLRSALVKVASALSPASRQEEGSIQEGIGGGLTSITADSIQRPTLEMIRRAIRSNRKVRIHYWSTTEAELALTVAPYDLRPIGSNWYLLANADEQGGVRPFKISRVRAVEILPDRFRYPRRFSADAYFAHAWETSGNGEQDILAKIKFAPSVASLVADSRRQQFVSVETQPDGAIICTVNVNSLKEIGWWILSYGAAAEVLEPAELRAEFARTAQAMASLYSAPPYA